MNLRSLTIVVYLFSSLLGLPMRVSEASVFWATGSGIEVPNRNDRQPLSPAELRENAAEITVKILTDDGWGSGFIVEKRGNIYRVATNDHVIRWSDSFQIQTADGIEMEEFYPAQKVESVQFERDDLAVLEFESLETYPTALLRPISTLEEGDEVFSAGYPESYDRVDERGFAFLHGVVLIDLERPLTMGYRLGNSTDFQKGMSGGPLLNKRGEVVGINGRHRPIWGGCNYQYRDGEFACDDIANIEADLRGWTIPIETFIAEAGNSMKLAILSDEAIDIATARPDPSPSPISSPLSNEAVGQSLTPDRESVDDVPSSVRGNLDEVERQGENADLNSTYAEEETSMPSSLNEGRVATNFSQENYSHWIQSSAHSIRHRGCQVISLITVHEFCDGRSSIESDSEARNLEESDNNVLQQFNLEEIDNEYNYIQLAELEINAASQLQDSYFPEEVAKAVEHWERAIEYLNRIPQSSDRYELALEHIEDIKRPLESLYARYMEFARNEAIQASELRDSYSPEEIAKAVEHWERAIQYLNRVPQSSRRYTGAQAKIEEYQRNLNHMRERLQNATRINH